MIPRIQKEVDGVTFEISGLDLRTERGMLVKLAKIIGPALAELAKGGEAAGVGVLAKLVASASDEDVEYFCATFAKVTRFSLPTNPDVKLPCSDAAFLKGTASQMKWLWACLENQFASFLGEKGNTLLQSLREKASL